MKLYKSNSSFGRWLVIDYDGRHCYFWRKTDALQYMAENRDDDLDKRS